MRMWCACWGLSQAIPGRTFGRPITPNAPLSAQANQDSRERKARSIKEQRTLDLAAVNLC